MERKVDYEMESNFLITDTEKKSFGKRLESLIPNRGLGKFASNAGMAESTIRSLIGGKSLPRLDNLIAIANTAKVTVEWLATGRGPRTYSDLVAESPGKYEVHSKTSGLMDNPIPESAYYGDEPISQPKADAIFEVATERGLFTRKVMWAVKDFIEMYNAAYRKDMPATPLEIVMEIQFMHSNYSLQNIERQIESAKGDKRKELLNVKEYLEREIDALASEIKEHRQKVYGRDLFEKNEH